MRLVQKDHPTTIRIITGGRSSVPERIHVHGELSLLFFTFGKSLLLVAQIGRHLAKVKSWIYQPRRQRDSSSAGMILIEVTGQNALDIRINGDCKMPDQFTSPIPSTLDKFHEAFFFLNQTMRSYHAPTEFRFNLNAFIQALRNITFMLQSEENKPERFAEWYAAKQEEMNC